VAKKRKVSQSTSIRFFTIRDEIVAIDRDLAAFYGIRTKSLNRAVKRNALRFPTDFSFYLTREEWCELRRERNEAKRRGGQGWVPRVFTEAGITMLGSVMRGPKATRLSIELMRTVARNQRSRASEHRKQEELLDLAERKVQALFDSTVDAMVMNQDEQPFTTPTAVTYFIQAGDRALIKIGSTKNLATRFRALQLMSPVQLTLLGVVPDDIEDECHRALAAWRVHGEWFQPSERVLAYIRQKCPVKSAKLK